MSNESEPKKLEALQDSLLSEIERFSNENPEIVEAMKVMNMSMADYIAAMDSVRIPETFSSSTDMRLPAELGY
jgi:hypothetical protein